VIVVNHAAVGLFSVALALGACQGCGDQRENQADQATPRTANNPGTTPPVKRPRRRRGIVGETAPTWKVSRWFNLPTGKDKLDVTDYRGKVVYLFFFQSW